MPQRARTGQWSGCTRPSLCRRFDFVGPGLPHGRTRDATMVNMRVILGTWAHVILEDRDEHQRQRKHEQADDEPLCPRLRGKTALRGCDQGDQDHAWPQKQERTPALGLQAAR